MTMKPKDLCLGKISKYLLVCLLIVIPIAAAAQTLEFNFATPVTLAATETPGDWYPDRYAPCGFVSPVKGPGNTKNVLQQSVCSNDYQTPTPSFYNTQGRKYDLIANTYSATINVYVPTSWKKTNARMAGFWATASNSSNVVGNDYPIMEFQGPITSDAGGPGYYPNGGVAGFYGWDNTANGGNGGFTLIGLPAGFQYNTWVELTMTLVPNKGFVYTVTGANGKGVSLKTGFYDPAEASLANVILEAYNYGSPYNIDWQNLSFSFTSLVCSK